MLGDIGVYLSDPFILNQSTSSPLSTDPDVDWSVFENAGMKKKNQEISKRKILCF